MTARRFDMITFDCYGTLIDWETGISEAFRDAAAADGVSLDHCWRANRTPSPRSVVRAPAMHAQLWRAPQDGVAGLRANLCVARAVQKTKLRAARTRSAAKKKPNGQTSCPTPASSGRCGSSWSGGPTSQTSRLET